jgi:hypothetical protein
MIKIKLNGTWTLAGDKFASMFQKYVHQNSYYREIPYIEDGFTISRENNDPFNATYIDTGSQKIPICDWEDVKVFLVDREPVNWHNARDYQTWAYYDYMYDNKVKKTYISKGSIYIQDAIVINIDNISPNIVFSLSRNSNNSVNLEKDDVNRTRVRICDNEWSRLGYRGFYYRMTMDPGMIIIPPDVNNNLINKIHIPANIQLIETDTNEEQCIMCCKYKKNIKFEPCNHNISCVECCKKMVNSKCPICKKDILSVTQI